MSFNAKNTLLFGLALLAAALAPVGISSKFYLDVLTLIFFTAYIGQSWNILGGYAGQFSFGGVMFFGTGAYTSSILLVTFGIPPLIGIFVAVLMGAFLGFLVGYLSFRSGLRGSYFALITLAFAELLRVLANSVEFTGGGVGLFLTYAPGLKNLQFVSPTGFYYFSLFLLVISLAIALWLERSRFGAQLIAIRENEEAAEALGIDTLKCKLYAIMIMGGMGGAAGTFYAQKYLYIDPPISYSIALSVEMLLVSIVGGLGTVFGPLIGSVVLHVVNEVARHFIDTPGLSLIVYGVILIFIISYLPNGLVGLFRRSRGKKEDGGA
ncbi:branched-chain amino acid ABC transporter permease [Rhodobacteraceae bacterium]|jgi:branched-chain amino acid transport system permease protein|nr:branched-chain amino acid ABC transporter permease [Paracoccaceae bacterium]MDA8578431.1 branched-chain amino acid ABC transporter permease [Paracoccaceae bacterium]MDA8635067.1 branched-chain amino acid ABC transporter permease [Paracoccaceae bacterium]MDA8647477.1 branched-chain amino acid ABC transporter permease [Paracoccaceae bacterium]MDA9855439.1 branched-chain amino acid ABC transporter permease [Paracoccaceae bacterium]